MHKAACRYLGSHARLHRIATQHPLVVFLNCTRTEVKEGAGTLTLLLEKRGVEKPQVMFSSARSPKRIRFSGQVNHADASGTAYLHSLPDYNKEPASLEIFW